MSTSKKVRGIDWDAIFKRRPDLQPPGYRETVQQILEEKTNEQT